MSKIKHIHLYRNGEVLGNRDLAVDRLKDFLNDNQDSDLDGVAILARYNSTSGDTTIVKTIVGFVYEGSNGTPKSITIFDNEATEGEISNLKTEIENKIYEAQVNANAYTDTKIATLDADDSPVDNNFVTSVSESDGKITVQRAAVASPTKTVSVTKVDGGGVNLDVNIDGATIVKNTDGKISVASAALTQYIGKDAVKVSEVDDRNNKTVSLKINGNDKVLSQTQDGLSATLSLIYEPTNRKLKLIGKNSEEPISNIDTTDFVKDGMLNDTAVFTASATTQSITFSRSSNTYEYSGLTKENHYLAFEFKISSGESSSYNYEILNATSIIDIYKDGDGLELTDHTFSVKKADGSEGFLTIDKDGVKISGVTDAIAAAAASAKTEVEKADNDQHIDVASAATDGHVTYTISSVDTASASGLSNEITDRENADKKIKESVGLDTDGSHKKTTTGNYTNTATTVVGEIAALDAQVTTNANNIKALEDKVKKADGSEGFLTIDEHGVKISGVTDAIAAAAASAKTEVKKADNDNHINVTTSTVTDGHVIYTISSKDIASATDLANVKTNVGLGADGSHKTTSGNYTSTAKTVTGEIAALDTKVKENADNITNLDTQVKKNADNITTLNPKVTANTNNITALEDKVSKLSGVTDAIAAAAASAKTEVKKATDHQHIDVTSAATEGHVTYTISSKDIASATELTNVKNNVGLGAGGNHIQTSGNYTSSATTVTGEIAALDTQVKKNETSITTLNSQVNEINGKIVKNAPKGSDAITVTEEADGSTIAIKLSATNSGLKIDESGLAIDFETLELDCGTY